MNDEPESVVPVFLRRLDANMSRLRDDMAEVKQRLTAIEIQAAYLPATEASRYAQMMLRMDRFETRLERIERRLDLTDAPAAT